MTSSGSEGRVVIDPEHLRTTAVRMRGAAEVFSSTGRHLATRPRPGMPAGLEAHVAEVVYQANRELQELALELVQEAGHLSARAALAEQGELDTIAWLMPGSHGFLAHFASGTETLSSLETSLRGGRVGDPHWAETALAGMRTPEKPSNEEAVDLRGFEELTDDSLLGLDGLPPAGVGLDLSVERDEGAGAQTGAARGALGIAFDESELGPTGIGLMACLVLGGAGQ